MNEMKWEREKGPAGHREGLDFILSDRYCFRQRIDVIHYKNKYLLYCSVENGIGMQERNLEVQLRGFCHTDPKVKSHCVPNQDHHVAQLHGALSNWQPCGWNGQTVFSSVIFSCLLDSRYTLITLYVVNIFSQLVITYFMIQHITVLNFHKVRFAYLLFNCF